MMKKIILLFLVSVINIGYAEVSENLSGNYFNFNYTLSMRPVPISPSSSNFFLTTENPLTFAWNDSWLLYSPSNESVKEPPDYYLFQISRTSDFSDLEINLTFNDTKETSYIIPFSDERYYWRIGAFNILHNNTHKGVGLNNETDWLEGSFMLIGYNVIKISIKVAPSFSAGDDVLISIKAENSSGLPVNTTRINIDVSYPNMSTLWNGTATLYRNGIYHYQNTLPSDAPVGSYEIYATATGEISAFDNAIFTVSRVSKTVEEINSTTHNIYDYLTGTILSYLQEINSTTYDNYNLLTEINTTTHSTLTKWGTKTAQNLYDLESQTKTIADYINDTRWGAYNFSDVMNKWGSYSASSLYSISNQTKTIADYINDTRWGNYNALELYTISNNTHTIADYINSTRWGNKTAQDLYDISDEIKTLADELG